MKIALVYDRVNKWGGAERVLLALKEIFPDAPLYTSVYHPRKAAWASIFQITPSFLQQIPFIRDKHEYLAPLMPHAFEQMTFDEYDVVISVSSEAAKGIITKPHTLHLCYCLTPTRYLWSGYTTYFANPLLQVAVSPLVWYLRSWDKIAARRPDYFVAISKEVQARIKTFYQQDAPIIYPPVFIEKKIIRPTKIFRTPYFLIVARLVPYKKVDLAVRAFNRLKLALKIVGSGSQESSLKRIAKGNIEFLGNLTEDQLIEYYKGCVALVFPGVEDFGLSILEAQSFGKPVIAYKGGGALETVIPGKTGIFFYPQTEHGLIQTIKRHFLTRTGRIKESHFTAEACRTQARKFGFMRFKKEFLSLIEKAKGRNVSL